MQLSISESATLVEKAGFKKGDRVVVNVNTPKEPAYFLGTVTRVSVKDKLVYAVLDNGGKMKAVVANTGGGVVGYASHTRIRKTAIPTANVQNHIDTSKWYAKKIDKPVAGERVHVPENKPTVPKANEPPKTASSEMSFDEKSAKAFLKNMRSGGKVKKLIKQVKDVPSAQVALAALNELKEHTKAAYSVASNATISLRAKRNLQLDKSFALNRLKDAESDVRAVMKGLKQAGASDDPNSLLNLAMKPGSHSANIFEKVNGGIEFSTVIEDGRKYQRFGFWRSKINDKNKTPFPVAMKVPGYSKSDFVKRLKAIEKRTKTKVERGSAPHRWTGKPNGNRTFFSDSKHMIWPEGTMAYLKAGVPPSRKFYRFVTGKDLPALPY
jgi:hypothetical protein